MYRIRLLLLALTFAIALVRAEAQPKEDPDTPAGETEGAVVPGKLRLALDPGGHTGLITSLQFTPDGKQLITAGSDHTIRVWDIRTGQLARMLRPPGRPIELCVVLSPDGEDLAVNARYHPDSKTDQYVVYLMALADGRIKRVLTGHTRIIQALAFSADGKRLVSGSDGRTIRIWNLNRNKLLQVHQTGTSVSALALSPDGSRVAEGCARAPVALKDVAGGKEIQLKGTRIGSWFGTNRVAWSPNGKVVGTVTGKGLQLWDPEGKALHQLLPKQAVAAMTFSADSSRVLTVAQDAEHTAWLFDVATGKEVVQFTPKGITPTPRNVSRCALSRDGTLAATSGLTDGVPEVFVWKTAGGGVVHRLAVPSWFSGANLQAGWSGDGKSLSWRKVEDVQAWKGGPATFDLVERRRQEQVLEPLQLGPPLAGEQFRGAVLEQDGVELKWIKGPRVGGSVQIVKNGKSRTVVLPEGRPTSSQFSPTLVGKDRAAIPTWSGRAVYLVDTNTGKVTSNWHPQTGVLSLAPSPDARWLLSLEGDQVLRVRHPETGAVLLSLYVFGPEWILWSEEGYYAASPGGEKLVGWVVDHGLDQASSYHPAQRFRKQLYRPDVIRLVLAKGSVAETLKAAGAGQAQNLERLLPPRTALVHKPEGTKVAIVATAEAGSKGQPVKELHLLVDGRPARLASGEAAVKTFATPLEKDARGEWNITLEPGLHKVSVRAATRDTYSISEEVAVDVPGPGPRPGQKKVGTLYYVGVGVNQFKHDPELNLSGAVPDILKMEKCLSKECADRFVEIKPTLLTDDKATGKAIVTILKELTGKLKPTDVVIVHYSSHGEVEPEGGLYLLCHDSKRGNLKETALAGQELRDILGQYPCPVLLILDACHSGKFPLMRPPTDPLSRLLADDSCGVAVMTAALAHQKAVDTRDGGVFTKALVEGLSGKARADEFSHRLFVHNLFMYVYGAVTYQTENKQMPLYLPSGSVPPIMLKAKE